MLKRNKQFRLFLLLITVLLFIPNSLLLAFPDDSRLNNGRKHFSIKVTSGFVKIAKSIDKALCKLASKLDAKSQIELKIIAHFYDKRAKRYFVSFAGHLTSSRHFPIKANKKHYYISSEGLLNYDIEFSKIKVSKENISCIFSGIFVVSIEDLTYTISKDIPNLVAAGVFSPATDLLINFFNNLNTGLIAEATAKTLVKFSRVSLTKLGADLINTAGKNKQVIKFIKTSVKDGSLWSFLALTIVRTGATSVVKIYGASLGATVGSMVAPGVGSTIGAFLGSKIMTMIAQSVIYKAMVEFPIKRSLKKILVSQKVLEHSPNYKNAIDEVDKNTLLVIKKIRREFTHNQFKLFDIVLKRIDHCLKPDRIYFVPLLKNLREILSFKILNEGDWYYAKRYYQLKDYVKKWGLQAKIRFNTKKNN